MTHVRVPIDSAEALRLMTHSRCLPADPKLSPGAIVFTDPATADLVVQLGGNIWRYIGANTITFGFHKNFKADLELFMAAQRGAKPDPKRLAVVVRHPKIKILTDCPRRLSRITFEEAELLVSWDCSVSIWGNLETQTFWCEPHNLQPLIALRELRKQES